MVLSQSISRSEANNSGVYFPFLRMVLSFSNPNSLYWAVLTLKTMKNLLFLAFALVGITSCSSDSFELTDDFLQVPEKSEINVVVSYLDWSEQCEGGCIGEPVQVVTFLSNAQVELFHGDLTGNDATAPPLMELRTNKDGKALLENIDPGEYTVIVKTVIGTKSRTLTTQLNKRSYIDFSF